MFLNLQAQRCYHYNYSEQNLNNQVIGDILYYISGGKNRHDFPIWDDSDITLPVVIINLPLANGIFGSAAPTYDLTIIEINLDTIWYSLDNGSTILSLLIYQSYISKSGSSVS